MVVLWVGLISRSDVCRSPNDDAAVRFVTGHTSKFVPGHG